MINNGELDSSLSDFPQPSSVLRVVTYELQHNEVAEPVRKVDST